MHPRSRALNHFRQIALLLLSTMALLFASKASAFDLMELLGLKKVDPVDLVDINVIYSLGRCSEKHPMLVTISNGSEDKIQYTEFNIWGKRENHSDILYSSLWLNSDRIIPPSETYTGCWRAPEPNLQGTQYPIEEIIWEPELTSAFFGD